MRSSFEMLQVKKLSWPGPERRVSEEHSVKEHSLCSLCIAPFLESIQIHWSGLLKASLNKLWTGKKPRLDPDELHSGPQPVLY